MVKSNKISFAAITIVFVLMSNLAFGQSSSQAFKKVDLANKEVLKNPVSAFTLATDALSLSIKTKNRKAEASAYNTLGTLYFNSGNYKKAIHYFLKAKNIYNKVKDKKNEEYTLKYLAKSYEATGQNKKSMGYYKKAEKKSSSDSAKFEYRWANTKLKKRIGKNKEAISDLEKELLNSNKIPEDKKINIYLELGDLYLEEKDTSKGLGLLKKAIDESFTNGVDMNADTLTINTLNSASNIYNNYGFTTENVATQKLALEESNNVGNTNLRNAANYNIGLTYIESDPNTAVEYLENSVHEGEFAGEKKWDHIQTVEKLSEAYANSGEYRKALKTYKMYVSLVDSIKQSEIEGRLNNEILNNKFKVQEVKIEQLQMNQNLRENELKEQKITIGLLALGISIFLVLTFFLVKNIRQKQHSNTVVQLASLRSQMNPHFIFNSLNSVNGFVSKNEERKANRYISDFSKLMRMVLNNSDKETIPFSDELASLRIYLSLEHSRFEDKFDYEIEVDPEINTEDIQVPPMLIQPHLENSIWHGLRYKEGKGFLKLVVLNNEDFIEVKIEDNGIGRQESQKLKTSHQRDNKSTGIKNTNERMKLLNKLYKTSLSSTIIDLEENGISVGTRVVIKLPILKDIANG